MKKLFAIMALVMLLVSPVCARDRVTRDVKELPAEAQTLLKKYYPKTGVNHIKIDSNLLGRSDYEVVLNTGTELDFDHDGNLKEIDCGAAAVPDGLVLKSIRDYVSKNFGGRKIVSLDINRNSYDVELSDGIDLEFDRSGSFKKIDD
ncbi:MAG: PepSY-like domain-containing protein [Muribaculaceae bacterium]|nr:PepSY-like domain-containing protein [Muribaculaceae bacterium]MDE6771752.1 PepSY-like domain-containing protein [Muribaculaceae bacterium]